MVRNEEHLKFSRRGQRPIPGLEEPDMERLIHSTLSPHRGGSLGIEPFNYQQRCISSQGFLLKREMLQDGGVSGNVWSRLACRLTPIFPKQQGRNVLRRCGLVNSTDSIVEGDDIVPPGSGFRPGFLLNQIIFDEPQKDGHKGVCFRKMVTSVGALILLSALIVVSVHPTLAAVAFADVKTTAKAGSSAAIAVGRQASSTLFRTELRSSAWTGFLAGCLHTLSGPDHLAALAPLSIGRTRMESAAVGALWGCGHDAGQVIFGILFLLLKDRLHIEVIRTWGTRVVGLTLLVIGAMGIKEALEAPTPCVALDGGDCDARILESAQSLTGAKKKFGFATFATGIVHGLQPDALMMILPALALPSRVAGAAFLGMFLLGTVLAMSSYTVLIGSCSQALQKRVPRITEKLTWASSLIAITFGVAILLSQLFGFSLF